MGIKGIYPEIGPGDRIALSKLAVEFLEKQQRPLRLAIDISIWLFQIQSGEGIQHLTAKLGGFPAAILLTAVAGGSNPALRTFYYRLLRLISLSIHPLFVFDGPNKPPFKRNKRTLGPGVKTTSIPEFLAKQLLENFGLPMHFAPGEAEAECALLQRLGHVDAVLSEDADTLMFGSRVTIRNLSPEGSLKTKLATHVNVYDAQKVSDTSGLDCHGMILVALMSGGDYVPEGIPGCGPKIACQAARAGFGAELCAIGYDDHTSLAAWKSRLEHELRTNESKFFSRKHCSLKIPQDFPRRDILRFYTHPCVSSSGALSAALKKELRWDRDIDIKELRKFTANCFEWYYVSGAKKFIRNLAPALLARALRLRASRPDSSDDAKEIGREESCLIKSVHLKRNHVSTDLTTELRVGFIPLDLVALDLAAELPDPQTTNDAESDEEDVTAVDAHEGTLSPKKKKSPSTYEPTNPQKIWLLESIVKMGVPLKVQDWEESIRAAQHKKSSTTSRTSHAKRRPKNANNGNMPLGALDQFATVTKSAPGKAPVLEPAVGQAASHASVKTAIEAAPRSPENATRYTAALRSSQSIFRTPQPLPTARDPCGPPVISLLSSPEQPLPKRRIFHSQAASSSIGSSGQAEATHTPRLLHVSSLQGRTSRDKLEPLHESLLPATIGRPRSPTRPCEIVSSTDTANNFTAASPSRHIRAEFQAPPELPQMLLRGDTARASVAAGFMSHMLRPPLTSNEAKNVARNKNTPDGRIETISFCSASTTPSRQNRVPLAAASASLTNAVLPLRLQPRKTDQASEIEKGTGNMVRLRQSLEGAWQIQEATPPEENQGWLGKKRKRTQWRVSQVEVLDLTEA